VPPQPCQVRARLFPQRWKQIEQVDVAVTLYTCIQELFGSNLGRDPEYTWVFRGLPQSLLTKKGVQPRPDHTTFFNILYTSLFHHSSCHYTLYSQTYWRGRRNENEQKEADFTFSKVGLGIDTMTMYRQGALYFALLKYASRDVLRTCVNV
jgi:hypothetical protein